MITTNCNDEKKSMNDNKKHGYDEDFKVLIKFCLVYSIIGFGSIY